MSATGAQTPGMPALAKRDIESAEALRELCDGGGQGGGVTHVSGKGERAGTGGGDFSGSLVEGVAGDIEQADAGAFLRECERCRATDAGCGAGDERNLTAQ